MPRQVRIEFYGAFCYGMARDNRLQPTFIAPNSKDQELFLKTFVEACERSDTLLPSSNPAPKTA